MYDLIIVGMGPGGMSAGIYAKRSGLKTLMLEKNSPGGLINVTNLVDNYLGYDNITGPELAIKMFTHVKNNGVEYKIEEVIKIKKEKEKFIIKTNKNEYESYAVVLAGGRSPRKLEIEDTLKNLRISRCSICDAPLYKEKDVLVLGGGNSAFEEGIYLSEFAKNLTIVSRSNMKADTELIEQAKEKENIILLENEEIEDIKEIDNRYIIKLTTRELTVDGIFSYIGYSPSTEYLSNLGIIDESGYIQTDNTETKIPGLFACGDIIKKEVYQIITASSEGAEAALKAKKYISKLKEEIN